VTRTIPLVAVGSVIALLSVAAPRASAQDAAASPEQARELFVQGVQASQEDRWADAVELFRRSRAILERPSAVFNTAVALSRIGRVVEALEDCERYLELADESDRSEAERYGQARLLLEELQTRVATLTLTVEPADAELEIDGRPREGTGAERSVRLDPGEHAVELRAHGFELHRFEVTLAPGARQTRAVELQRPGTAPPPASPFDEDDGATPTDGGGGGGGDLGTLGLVGIIVGGVGVGAGVVALGTGVASQSTYDDLGARCPGDVCPADAEGDISSGESLAVASTVMLGLSVVGIGVGVALLIVDLTSGGGDEAQAVRVVPSEGGAALRVAF